MSKENQEEFNAIYRNLATLRHDAPDSKEAQAAIKVWYDYLQNFGEYSLDAFKGLGQMYVADERFTKNIDKFGEGLAQFMCDAMEGYADRNKIKSKTGGDFLHLFYFYHIIQSLISRIVQMRIFTHFSF